MGGVLYTSSAWSQNAKVNTGQLEGKTFLIRIYTFDTEGKNTLYSTPDEIIFAGKKFHSKQMGRDYRYTPDVYTAQVDSANTAGEVSFAAFTRNEKGEIEIFWKGTVTDNTVKGTMHWFSQGKTKMFSGGLKYESEEK